VISFDTNILFYAAIEDCTEHAPAMEAVRDALKRPHECVIADQVYFELYRLLRNPAVLRRPFDAPTAAALVSWYRDRSGFGRCAWETAFYADLAAVWSSGSFPSRRTFDAILAVTLRRNGVIRLFTRNLRDFADCGFEAVDPIGGQATA
jgi:predicted nucleic acid-binding protein